MNITLYKQGDARWGFTPIVNGLDLEKAGCLITSLSMIDGRTPDKMLKLLKEHGCFDAQGKLYCDRVAQTLGLHYRKITHNAQGKIENPNCICIMETNHFADKGIPQHFVVYLPTLGSVSDVDIIADPIDGQIKSNPYEIVSFRLFNQSLEA